MLDRKASISLEALFGNRKQYDPNNGAQRRRTQRYLAGSKWVLIFGARSNTTFSARAHCETKTRVTGQKTVTLTTPTCSQHQRPNDEWCGASKMILKTNIIHIYTTYTYSVIVLWDLFCFRYRVRGYNRRRNRTYRAWCEWRCPVVVYRRDGLHTTMAAERDWSAKSASHVRLVTLGFHGYVYSTMIIENC